MKLVYRLLVLIMTTSLVSCEYNSSESVGCTDPLALNYEKDALYDSGDCEYSHSYKYSIPEFWDESDNKGNLLIINQLGEPIHFFVDEEHYRTISEDGNTGFLVNVISDPDYPVNMGIWRVSDVDDITAPPREEIYRNWIVPNFEHVDSIDKPEVWIINKNEPGFSGSGKVYFNYPSNDNDLDYNVDIYLHSREGARLTSLAAGTKDRELRFDYGNYIFHYRYWISESSTSEGSEEIGWIESDWVTLNSNTDPWTVDIPAFNVEPEKYAGLKVVNGTDEVVKVRSSGNDIEHIVLNPGNTQELSSIAKNDSIIYLLEEDAYNLSFINLQAAHVDAFNSFEVYEGMTARLVVGEERDEITVNNETAHKWFFGDKEHFLGMSVDANETKKITIPVSARTELTVFRADSTFFEPLTIENDILIIEE